MGGSKFAISEPEQIEDDPSLAYRSTEVMRRELTLLAIYWIVAASSFVWIPYIAFDLSWMVVVVSTVLVVLSGAAVLFGTYIGVKRHMKEMLIIFSLAPALLGTLLLAWLTTSFALRYVLSAFWAAFFVGVFNFALYFEYLGQQDKPRADLAHTRYLEYGRSFFWVAVFTLVAYIAWEFSALGSVDVESGSEWRRGVLGLLQLLSVFGTGGGITFWAFHRKLCEIEELRKHR